MQKYMTEIEKERRQVQMCLIRIHADKYVSDRY